MMTIKRDNKVPMDVAAMHGGTRRFRQRMRRTVAQAKKAMMPLGTLVEFTFADPKDVRDVQVLLDRIASDLSQQNWGK